MVKVRVGRLWVLLQLTKYWRRETQEERYVCGGRYSGAPPYHESLGLLEYVQDRDFLAQLLPPMIHPLHPSPAPEH